MSKQAKQWLTDTSNVIDAVVNQHTMSKVNGGFAFAHQGMQGAHFNLSVPIPHACHEAIKDQLEELAENYTVEVAPMKITLTPNIWPFESGNKVEVDAPYSAKLPQREICALGDANRFKVG